MISERDVIYISKKQASITVALIVLGFLLSFMCGYFWGKQAVLESFSPKMTEQSNIDQADYVSTMQAFSEKSKQENEEIDKKVTEDKEQAHTKDYKEQESSSLSKNSIKISDSKKQTNKQHKAILIGFGTRPAALSFVNRLKKYNIPVDIKTRVSKSASGKAKKTWYQVVTKSYNSKDDLMSVLQKIKKLERIKESDIKNL